MPAEFTPSQRRVIEHEHGNLAVLAVAGAGKTTVMTERAARLINRGVCAPERMLLVTFTRRAADSMRDKLSKLLAKRAPDVRTFHAFALGALRHYAPARYKMLIGGADSWLPASWADQVFRRLGSLHDLEKPGDVLRIVDRCRAQGLHPSRINDVRDPFRAAVSADDREIYQAYADFSRAQPKAELGDLIVDLLDLLRSKPEIAEASQGWFDQVMVDEYQDTDPSQEALLEIVCSRPNGRLAHEIEPRDEEDRPTLMVIGDDDQSIYRFRSAEPEFILDFVRRWHATRIFMEENFRSHSSVLDAANKLIRHNRVRTEKQLRHVVGDVGAVRLLIGAAQASRLVDEIMQLRGDDSTLTLRDFAVLYRTHAQSCTFESELCTQGVPYVTADREGFYGLRSVRPLLDYLRLFLNPDDQEALARVWNKPSRFLKSDWLRTAREQRPRASAIELLTGLTQAPAIPSHAVLRLQHFADVIRDGVARREENTGQLLNWLLRELQYEADLRTTATARGYDAEDAISQVRSMLLDAGKFEDAQSFIGHVDRMIAEAKKDDRRDAVRLSTLHAAKGLEFSVVFLVGMTAELMPHPYGEEEEERRLAYVGVTRARRFAYLCCDGPPSRYLAEMGFTPEMVRAADPSGAQKVDHDLDEFFHR